jgi:hypothetical protein
MRKFYASTLIGGLLLALAGFAAGPQSGGWGLGGNPRSGQPLAFFEAFPATGQGTFGPCSTTAPTGAKG